MTLCPLRKFFNHSVSISLLILLFSFHGVRGTDATDLSPFNDDGSLRRIAAIQILPYDPLREDDGSGYHMDKYKLPASYPLTAEYKDHFGFGRNCVYVDPTSFKDEFASAQSADASESKTEDGAAVPAHPIVSGDIKKSKGGGPISSAPEKRRFVLGSNGVWVGLTSPEDESSLASLARGAGSGDFPLKPSSPSGDYYEVETHEYYLEHLGKYKQSLTGLVDKNNHPFSDKNYLLVRVDVSVPGTSTPKKYMFGVFVSGEKELFEPFGLKELKKDLEPKNLEHLIGQRSKDNIVHKAFSLVKTEKKTLSGIDQIARASADAAWLTIFPMLPKEYIFEDKLFYPLKLLHIDGKVFPPFAQTVDKEQDLLSLRVFGEGLQLSYKDMSSLDSYEVNRKKRKFLLRNLFGGTSVSSFLVRNRLEPRTKVADSKVDLEPAEAKQAYDTVFKQSEQAFLSFLSLTTNEHEAKEARRLHLDFEEPHPSGEGFDAYVYLYSTKDICRYCRSTLAYQLSNDLLKGHLGAMFKKIGASFTFGDIKLYAFSFDETDT